MMGTGFGGLMSARCADPSSGRMRAAMNAAKTDLYRLRKWCAQELRCNIRRWRFLRFAASRWFCCLSLVVDAMFYNCGMPLVVDLL